MKTFTIESSYTVTQEDVDDIVSTALEGGITYWCDTVRVKDNLLNPPEDFDYLSYALTRGFDLELHDREYGAEDEEDYESGGWHVLTLDNLLEALGELHIDFDNYDANDADKAIQTAIFGELIYG